MDVSVSQRFDFVFKCRDRDLRYKIPIAIFCLGRDIFPRSKYALPVIRLGKHSASFLVAFSSSRPRSHAAIIVTALSRVTYGRGQCFFSPFCSYSSQSCPDELLRSISNEYDLKFHHNHLGKHKIPQIGVGSPMETFVSRLPVPKCMFYK
ncbi:unnamed protein product [Linum trigynum]|uniref:Uncharacterized protein n=1 Tax=Linum trigynum TaxID=586398 RepID=A0AAV2F9S9_9ROSI